MGSITNFFAQMRLLQRTRQGALWLWCLFASAGFAQTTSASPHRNHVQEACVAGQMAPVRVRGHGRVIELAAELQTKSSGLYEKAAAWVGATDCAPIEVHLVVDRHAAKVELPAWHLPPWAAGAAMPHARSIVLMVHTEGRRHDRERVLLHEMGHLATAAAAGGHQVPRWFDEGVARRLAGEDTQDDDRVLAVARLGSTMIPLEGLDVAFPGDAGAAAIAYAVAGRALELLEDRYGGDIVRRVLVHIRDGADFENALHAETGLWTYQLSGEVERSVAKWHAWFTLMHGLDFGMGFGGFLLIWAGVRARRRLRQRLADMPDEPLWDIDASVVRWTVRRDSLFAMSAPWLRQGQGARATE